MRCSAVRGRGAPGALDKVFLPDYNLSLCCGRAANSGDNECSHWNAAHSLGRTTPVAVESDLDGRQSARETVAHANKHGIGLLTEGFGQFGRATCSPLGIEKAAVPFAVAALTWQSPMGDIQRGCSVVSIGHNSCSLLPVLVTAGESPGQFPDVRANVLPRLAASARSRCSTAWE